MSVVKFDKFSGMIPGIDDRLLPDGAASYSRDAYLYRGTLQGWRTPKLLFNLVNATTRMAFRIPQDATRPSITELAYWLEFADADTNVLRTPVFNDSFQRYYYASPSLPPKYNTLARIAAGQGAWFLGIPAPTVAPAVTVAGGTGTAVFQSRSYVYTYLSAYGEESAPSPPLVVNGYNDDTWSVFFTDPAAADQGTNRNLTQVNIYRTITGTNGIASYFLVATVNVGTGTYLDTISDTTVAQSVELPSTTWTPPPSDLQGFVAGANGMFFGWRENEIWISEPFRPHTWPSTYVVTTDYPIVGMGVVGQSIMVVTRGFPVVLSGTHPSTLTTNVIRQAEPCTFRGAIVSAPDCVYYPSPNGLQAVTPYGTISNTTERWITREFWQTIFLKELRAVMNGPAYFGFGTVVTDPNTHVETSQFALVGVSIHGPKTSSSSFSAPPGSEGITNPAFEWLAAPNALAVYNVLQDFWTSVPMLLQNQAIYYYDFTDVAPTPMPYKWTSRIFQEGAKKNYEGMRVWFNVPAGTVAQNTTRQTATIQNLAADQYGVIRVYAGDGAPVGASGTPMTLLTTREIRNSGELLRINSGQKYEFWQIEIEGRVEILNVQLASNVKELANV